MAGCPICEDLNHGVAGCPHSLVGTTLGKYRVEAFLAAGGMGVVYTGEHQSLGSPVAIKTLHRALLPQNARTDARRQIAETLVKRFTEEARRAANLRHPNIVRVEDLGVAPDGTPYLAMELLEGLSLKELLERDGPLPPRRATALVAQALDALEFAHRRNIIHRDIKPENLFLQHPGQAAESIKVLDFGIAKAVGDGATQLGLTHSGHGAMGTFYYMSPEQAADPRQVTASSDVFSVGASLFELLTGHTVLYRIEAELLTSGLMAVLRAIIDGRIERHPRSLRGEVPEWLDAAVARSLSHDPTGRFAAARDMAEALRAGDAGPVAAASPLALASTAAAPPSPRPAPPLGSTTAESAGEQAPLAPLAPVRPRSKAPWILAACLAAGAAVAAALVTGGGGQTSAAGPVAADAAIATAATSVDAAAPGLAAAPAPAVAQAAPADAAPTPEASAEAEPEAAPASKPHGFLSVNSRPRATIIIDGHDTGDSTPQRHIRLLAGKHQITLVTADNAIRESFTVRVRPGETTHLVKRLGGAETGGKGCDEVACLIEPDKACCRPAKTAEAPAEDSRPERLEPRDVRSSIARVRRRVLACGSQAGFKGRVTAKVRVVDGRVASARARATPPSPAVAACVRRALRAARFPRAQKPLSFSYPFRFD